MGSCSCILSVTLTRWPRDVSCSTDLVHPALYSCFCLVRVLQYRSGYWLVRSSGSILSLVVPPPCMHVTYIQRSAVPPVRPAGVDMHMQLAGDRLPAPSAASLRDGSDERRSELRGVARSSPTRPDALGSEDDVGGRAAPGAHPAGPRTCTHDASPAGRRRPPHACAPPPPCSASADCAARRASCLSIASPTCTSHCTVRSTIAPRIA